MQGIRRLLGQSKQCFGERVQGFLALGFRRLDHDRLWDSQREVDRRSVEALVQQAFGKVHRRDAFFLFEPGRRSHELVHAAVALRHGQEVLDAAQQVVGVQHRVLRNGFQPIGAVGADVAVRADQDADVAEEAADAADRFRTLGVQTVTLAVERDDGRRQVIPQLVGDADRARPGSASAMRTGKCLVRIEMHHVGAEIAGTRDAQDGVHVGAVQIDQPAAAVNPSGDLTDLPVEQSERVGIGHHQHRDVVVQFRAGRPDRPCRRRCS